MENPVSTDIRSWRCRVSSFYGQQITLRNCGRFTVVKSDFGADYRTHTHVTEEAFMRA